MNTSVRYVGGALKLTTYKLHNLRNANKILFSLYFL